MERPSPLLVTTHTDRSGLARACPGDGRCGCRGTRRCSGSRGSGNSTHPETNTTFSRSRPASARSASKPGSCSPRSRYAAHLLVALEVGRGVAGGRGAAHGRVISTILSSISKVLNGIPCTLFRPMASTRNGLNKWRRWPIEVGMRIRGYFRSTAPRLRGRGSGGRWATWPCLGPGAPRRTPPVGVPADDQQVEGLVGVHGRLGDVAAMPATLRVFAQLHHAGWWLAGLCDTSPVTIFLLEAAHPVLQAGVPGGPSPGPGSAGTRR